jgi:NAD(P)-dependent dehydrogenase (short-subunit alcohol dehydrogenase family)
MADLFRLDGKIALITGAARGIGRAISVTLAGQGATVVLADLPAARMEETRAKAAACGGQVLALVMDVRDLAQIRSTTESVLQELGRIDILVNNVGINRPAGGLDVSPEEWEDHFAANTRGGFFLAQAVAPAMIRNRWGRIIFISSQSGLVGFAGQPVYCATKGAVIQIVRSLALEWATHGITVNSVAPTFVETDLTRKRLENPEFRSFVLDKIPAGRLALPEEVAAAVAYLASGEAAMVNGATLSVDGGWTAG